MQGRKPQEQEVSMTTSDTLKTDAGTHATRLGFLEILTQASPLVRRAREAELLYSSSDEELARRGLKRDEILDQVFRIYRGL
jgi:hypothetical protein